MPLKPIFDKAPLMTMTTHPLCAGLVRMENPTMTKLYAMVSSTNETMALEGAFRLACIVTAKPAEEPVAAKIRAMLATQKEDGSFMLSFKQSVAVLRAAWALYEYEARKPMLDHIAKWCAYAVQHWDDLMADDDIWAYSADLLELLENLYRVTGKAAVLTLCERVATQTMGWSSVLNTISNQRPTSKAVSKEELEGGLAKENGSREGYYNHFLRINHAEALADGARSTIAKGWYSGSATELNASHNGWERLYRHHGAICGGLTSDELLEGTSPAELVSTAALGAWAEALSAAAHGEKPAWAIDALERMAYNAMPACLNSGELASFQRVNMLNANAGKGFCVVEDHAQRALIRLVRGYGALCASVVTARENGADINLYIPGRYAVPMDDSLLVLSVASTAKGANITVHTRQEVRATIALRMPAWSRNSDVTVNGADIHADVKNGMMTFDRTWHEGDIISLSFEPALVIVDGHHQGKYVQYGPVVMALQADHAWQKAFVSAAKKDQRVVAVLESVKEWKLKEDNPADIPVLPETKGDAAEFQLVPYAKTTARIALFPGRKQA